MPIESKDSADQVPIIDPFAYNTLVVTLASSVKSGTWETGTYIVKETVLIGAVIDATFSPGLRLPGRIVDVPVEADTVYELARIPSPSSVKSSTGSMDDFVITTLVRSTEYEYPPPD
tara:strand:- start:152 stop:502 length:351 start_codon:yes stop_codon:yes gene_type:complete